VKRNDSRNWLSRAGTVTLSASFEDSPEVDSVVASALAKDPSERPGSATALIDAFGAALHRARVREWKAREAPRRRWLAAALIAAAVAIAAGVDRLPPVQSAERRTLDSRFALMPPHPPSPEVLLVLLDEKTLRADATPLVQRAAEFGTKLDLLFDHGASSVAVDFLLPQQWAESQQFAETLMRHHDRLALAAFSAPDGSVIGPECVSPMAASVLGARDVADLFGFVNLNPDRDGVMRNAQVSFVDRKGNVRPSLAWRTAAPSLILSRPWSVVIDQSTDWNVMPRLSWNDVDLQLAQEPGFVRGKRIVVGASYVGSGDQAHRVVTGGRVMTVPGAIVQALIVDSILRQFRLRDVPLAIALLSIAAVMYVIATLAMMRPDAGAAVLIALLLVAAYVVTATASFRFAHVVFPVIAPLLLIVITAAATAAARRFLPPYPRNVEELP
jgi:CHASE2 domain-containing sensor protein